VGDGVSLLSETRVSVVGGSPATGSRSGRPHGGRRGRIPRQVVLDGVWLERLWDLVEDLFDRDWDRLAFVMQHQQQTEWCWAALTASVSCYYNGSSSWTQCRLVNAELNQAGCCVHGGSSQCNNPWYPEQSLTRTGNLDRMDGAAASFDQVDTEIDAGRPLGVRIAWAGGGGHAVAVAGYLQGTGGNHLAIADPWYGASDVLEDTFRMAYQGTGSWNATYVTRS
jgi:hypothetical protein